MSRILIVEDEVVIRQSLQRLLTRNGYSVAEAGTVTEALEQHDPSSFDLIIADLRLPGALGTQVIDHCGDTPVIIMTSYASVHSAVESMKKGAADYIAKPFDHDEMILMVERLLQQSRLARQNIALKHDLERNYPVTGLVGNCTAMQEVFSRIKKVAPTDTTVLILGESGTGKELVARALHETSPRKDGPIITVNCAAIPDTLIESELFGHEKGAFTGAVETRHGLVEAADGGTLFLDEIGELPLPAQGRLLRVLQEGEIRRVGATHERKVDVRLIAATHRDLQQQVKAGRFREDLYFRLRVIEIGLPPLRERGKDVVKLAEFLLAKACGRLNRAALRFTPAALKAVLKYRWPGNVREMENAIERAVILADGHDISPEMLSIEPVRINSSIPSTTLCAQMDLSLEDYFRRFVIERQETQTETELAKRLGISRKTLWEKRQRLGIHRTK